MQASGRVAKMVVGILCLSWPAWAHVVYHGKTVRQLPPQATEIPSRALAMAGVASALPGHLWPHPIGVRPMAALLVDFPDAPADFTPAEVDSFLNAPGYKRFGNHGSVRDFYLDVTGGKLDIHYAVYGYYRAKQKKTYYENVGNYAGGDQLTAEVLQAMDGAVNFGALGTAGESAVNSVAILYAGDEHDGDLWGTTTQSDLKLDGKTIGRVYWAGLGQSAMSMAVDCHEMGHMLFNWPDLYLVPQDGLGAHCLMADYADDFNPVPPDEALRADQGWIDVQDLAADSRGVFPVPANANRAYRFLNPARNTESFFAVNRLNVGRYASLGGRGMLIFHFDMDWNETADTTKAAVMLVADQGRIAPPPNWVEPAWYFYQENMEEFSAAKQKTGNAWHDGSASGIRLFNISPRLDTMSFSMGDASVSLAGRFDRGAWRFIPQGNLQVTSAGIGFDLLGAWHAGHGHPSALHPGQAGLGSDGQGAADPAGPH